MVAEQPDWKGKLDELLVECSEARKRRRADLEKIATNETALKMAIAVRYRLDDMLLQLRLSANKGGTITITVKDLIEDVLEEELDCPSERLWEYLQGNPRNLLSVAMLNDVTAKWQAWLDKTTAF